MRSLWIMSCQLVVVGRASLVIWSPHVNPVMKLNAFTLNHKIFSLGIACLDEVVSKVLSGFSGEIQESIGTYYSNRFPDISSLDDCTKQRVSYFPPKFI